MGIAFLWFQMVSSCCSTKTGNFILSYEPYIVLTIHVSYCKCVYMVLLVIINTPNNNYLHHVRMPLLITHTRWSNISYSVSYICFSTVLVNCIFCSIDMSMHQFIATCIRQINYVLELYLKKDKLLNIFTLLYFWNTRVYTYISYVWCRLGLLADIFILHVDGYKLYFTTV